MAHDYFVFATSKNICLYALPVDGNPFRSLGILGHCEEVKLLKTTRAQDFAFTIGRNCHSVFVWKVDPSAVMERLAGSGSGLKPYCNLIPHGGMFGSFFQEMQDLFYYMQLISNYDLIEGSDKFKNYLEVNEVPDWMRGLGFFPTDYEIECMTNEMTILKKRQVSFEDLVKLFLNYAPLEGIPVIDIEHSIRNVLLNQPSEDVDYQRKIKTAEIEEILTAFGERVEERDAKRYLKELWGEKDQKEGVSVIEFLDDLLSVRCNL